MSVEASKNGKNKINICLYSEEYTFVFTLTNIGWYGGYDANLYYYDVESKDKDYAEFAHLVNLLNDFTNYVAYDTKNEENHFELLFNEASQAAMGFASDEYHHDSLIGSVSYSVNLDHKSGYYYMMEKDNELEMDCYRFQFKGLLKPLEYEEDSD